jgi:hypothetical protein
MKKMEIIDADSASSMEAAVVKEAEADICSHNMMETMSKDSNISRRKSGIFENLFKKMQTK